LLADHVVERRGTVLAGQNTVGRSLDRPRKRVAEQAGAIRRWRRLELSVVLEQARHAGQMSAAAAAPWGVANMRWETDCTTRADTHCGCFLPDLTGFARRPSAADLPEGNIMLPGSMDKASRTHRRHDPLTVPIRR